jgi:prolipoprotein diacylglyceryltransferase
MSTILPFDLEMGIFAGLAVAMAGYLKAYAKVDEKGNREKFSLDKFVTTICLGAIIGGSLSYLSLQDDAVMMFLSTAGITVILEDIIVALLRLEAKKDAKPAPAAAPAKK